MNVQPEILNRTALAARLGVAAFTLRKWTDKGLIGTVAIPEGFPLGIYYDVETVKTAIRKHKLRVSPDFLYAG